MWYESWHPIDWSPSHTGVNIENYVYWNGFWCPATGVYTNVRVRVRYNLADAVNSGELDVDIYGNPSDGDDNEVATNYRGQLYCNVYESTNSTVSPKPTGTPLGTTGTVILDKSNEFLDINIGNCSLTRNKIYFIALKWKTLEGDRTSSNTFYCSDYAFSEQYH